MPKPASIEDAPNFLKLLQDYGKMAVTLSLALLSLSVAFTGQLVNLPVDSIQAILLASLWGSLFLALFSGIMIIADLTHVSSNYIKALRIAYPDALTVLSTGTKIKVENPNEEIEVTDQQQQQEIKSALNVSSNRMVRANKWANFSFWMFGLASLLIVALGLYGSIYRGFHINASAAVDSSRKFVADNYNLTADDVNLRSLLYDDTSRYYTVEMKNVQVATETFTVIIDASSGDVISIKQSP